MRRWTRLMVVLAASVVMSLGTGCQVNPATGQRQLNMLSREQEISLGAEAAPQFLSEMGGPIPSPTIRQYVSNVGQRLAAESERTDLPWEFNVVDSSTINAFALPGGKVFISRGLLAKMDNEAQLAGVLGHEIGHVTAQHIGQQMTRQVLIQTAAVGLAVAGEQTDEDWLKILGAGTSIGGGVYLLSFGRNQELQSDRLALRYMTDLGYNPVGMLQVLEILEREAGGAPEQLQILSTHPHPEQRIEQLNELVREEYPRYDETGYYRFEFDRFRANVLDELKGLPPATHGRDRKQQ